MRTALIFLAVAALFGCKPSQKTTKPEPKPAQLDLELLYGVWNVASITTAEQTASGKDMGDPQYEFTRDGKRVKSYKTPPHSEFVRYAVSGDTVRFPENPKLPASRIAKLTKDSLVLSNPTAVWRLYR